MPLHSFVPDTAAMSGTKDTDKYYCDGCKFDISCDTRWNCQDCTPFDLCNTCYCEFWASGEHHVEGHKFARVKREEDEGRCETCKQTFDRYHRDFAEVCVTCGDDYNNICGDCMIDSGKSCDRCDIFKCYPCQDQSSGLDFCEECYNYFCDSCMKMRPYKGDAHICGECFAKKPSWKLPANFGSEKMPLAERKVFSDIAKAYEDSGETRRVG